MSFSGRGWQVGRGRTGWKLDYTGRRPPLIILEPSLERATGGQAAAIFYADGRDGRPHKYELKSPEPLALLLGSPEQWFVTVEKGKSAGEAHRVGGSSGELFQAELA